MGGEGSGVARAGAAGSPVLRRVLGRLDTVLLLISAMVVLDTLGAVAVGGGQVLTWLVLLFVTFFVPSALATAELGAALPAEGGTYVWVREAFGQGTAALASLLYWAATPVWVGGSVTVMAIAVTESLVVPLPVWAHYGFGLGFVAVATLGAVVPLRYGKWVPSSGAITQVVLLVFFTVTAVLYGVRHGVHPLPLGALSPSTAVFVAVVPVLLYSFVGLELPSSAAEEMRDPSRDVPMAIAQAGVAQVLMYAVPVVAILLVVPTGRISSLGGLIDALRTVFTVYGGKVAADGSVALSGAGSVAGWVSAVAFCWVLLASASAWTMGTARTQAAACRDGAGPRALGRISPRTGAPVVMSVLSGGVAAAMVVAGLAATQADSQRYFTITLAAGIAFEVLAFLAIYPTFAMLRHRRPALHRPFRAPGGTPVAWGLSGLAMAWTLAAAACLLWPGLGTERPDDALPAGFAGDRVGFELLVAAPVAGLIGAFAAWQAWHRLDAGRGRHSRG